MKEYFVRFITGRVGVYRSFFLHFILVYILGISVLLGLDSLFPDAIPVVPGISILFLFVGIAFVGTSLSAVRTLVSGGERFIHRTFSGLVIVLMIVFLSVTIKDLAILWW
jgi:hypothetical protein